VVNAAIAVCRHVCVTAAAAVAGEYYSLATQGRAGQVFDEDKQLLSVQCAETAQAYCMQRVQPSV